MSKVKQYYTDLTEKQVDNIIFGLFCVDDILSKYVINEISFKDAKSKIMKLDNLNLVNIDEDNIDEVLILEKEDYYKKLNKEGRSQ